MKVYIGFEWHKQVDSAKNYLAANNEFVSVKNNVFTSNAGRKLGG